MRPFGDVTLRSATAVAIVIGLLGLVVTVYFRDGYDRTEQVFTLLQGVLLGAFGWLYGSHGVEQAENLASSAEAGRRIVVGQTETVAERLMRAERELAQSRLLLAEAMAVPGVRERVMASLASMEVDADDA